MRCGEVYLVDLVIYLGLRLQQLLVMRCSVKNIIVETRPAVLDERIDHSSIKIIRVYYNFSSYSHSTAMRDSHKEQIEQNTTQWTNMAYKLQTMTGRSTLKMVKLFKYPLKSQTHRFSNKENIDALVDVTDYKAEYKNKVITQTIPLEDVIFFCGHVNIKKYHSEPNKIFTFLICKVNLGKIGKFSDTTNHKIDSIFIPAQTPNEPYHFNFLLSSYNQYEVKYQVSFVIGDDHQIRNKETTCSICEQNLATVYCRDEKMHFCDNCCNKHHLQLKLTFEREFKRQNASQFTNKKDTIFIPQLPPHQLEKLNRVNSLPLCESHSIKNEYFCLKCQKYVCNICIQKGTHNQNPEHVIKHIDYLYQEKEENNNTITIRLKEKLEKLIEDIEMHSNAITQNYQAVRKKLTTEFQKALACLEDAYFDKISRVNSDEIELNMNYQKIEWTKAFILHQEKYLKPIHYFKLQARFENQINSIRIAGFDESFNIQPDLDCFIEWQVSTNEQCQTERTKRRKDQEIHSKTQTRPTYAPNYANPRNNDQNSIYKFDSKSQAPKRGQLSLLLQKSDLSFFKFKTLNGPLTRQ